MAYITVDEDGVAEVGVGVGVDVGVGVELKATKGELGTVGLVRRAKEEEEDADVEEEAGMGGAEVGAVPDGGPRWKHTRSPTRSLRRMSETAPLRNFTTTLLLPWLLLAGPP